MEYHFSLPLSEEERVLLKPGDLVYLSGIMHTARDAAHARMNGKMPVPMETIYYLGPSPARPGQVIGSAGPTTSGRMDRYTPALLDAGLRVMIGKGRRSKEVIDSMIRNKAVYLAATGGAGALLSKCITKASVIAYEDLGTEAIRELEVKDFPAIVAIDCRGDAYGTYH